MENTDVLANVHEGKKKASNVVRELKALDQSQVKAMESVKEDLSTMRNYLSKIDSKVKSGDLSITSFHIDPVKNIDEYSVMRERIYGPPVDANVEQASSPKEVIEQKEPEKNAFQKSLDSFKEIGSDIWSGLEERASKRNDSWYDFGNYITLGLLDTGKDLGEGLESRAENRKNSTSDYINWLTMGGVDLVQGAVNPEENFSKEHWLSSFGLATLATGARVPGKSSSPSPSPKSQMKPADLKSLNGPRIKNVTSIHEWYIRNMPEIGVVQDSLGGYHLAVRKGDGRESSNETSQNSTIFINTISELKNTDNFRKGALEHILEGELNARGKPVGFHYEGLSTRKGSVIPGSESSPNKFGVYEAKVEIEGYPKTSNGGKSTFFPKEWDAQKIVDAINEAYNNKVFVEGSRNTYIGEFKNGMQIQMYIDKKTDTIISAFPIY